ncbi:hypothetical protein [Pontibacter sp. H249]|uniref:hypothetical protein n=1 Tax=Pontibacter sp. H249 TaxID=3133420 RepID=UPI0030BED4D2
MDLNQLKQSWQQAGTEKGLSTKQIEQMTKISLHPVLGRIRIKLMVEAVAMTVLLLIFYNIFDGHLKPVYASVVLVVGVLFYMASNLYSFITLKHTASADSIVGSLHTFLHQLQRAKIFSLTAMVVFSVSLWVFFTAALSINMKFILVFAALAGVTMVFLYLSSRTWSQRIGRISQSIDELES